MKAIELVGWAGNAAFFSRFFVQWLASERAQRTVAPRSFWWMSLAGTVLLGAYSVATGEPVLLAGYFVNGAIYCRNLWLRRRGRAGRGPSLVVLIALAVLATALIFGPGAAQPRDDLTGAWTWLAVAVVGQTIWSGRFLVQWWMSERRRESHFPIAFWWLSLLGNALLLAYAIHLQDPVYVAGFCIGPIVQVRNLMLSLRRRPDDAEGAGEPVREIVPEPRRARVAGQRSGRNAGGVPE